MVGLVVALVGAGGVAYARTHGSGPDYRTASVQTGSATHALLLTGTIGPALQQTVTFPISGTVATVNVQPGQPIAAGAVLATLQSSSQQAAVTSARATLANAELTLYQAENGQTGASTGSGGGARSADVVTAAVETSGGKGAAGSGSIVAAQHAVLSSQQKVDQLLATTRADLALAGTLCAASATPTPTPTATGADPSPTTGTPAPTQGPGQGTYGHGPTRGKPTTCAGALQQVLTDQAATLTVEENLSRQEGALNKLLEHQTSATSGVSAGRSGGSSSAAASGATTTGVSATQLAADQAAVDAAQAQLQVAQQDLAQTTIVSPIGGTVVSVGLTVGQRAGTTSGIQVVGSSAHVVTTDVPVSSISTVKVGQRATVAPDGSATTLAGTVAQISIAPVTESSTTSYTVTVGLNGSPTGLHDGASAAVSLITGASVGAVVVPTSAVHSLGSFAYVTMISAGGTTAVPVTVGVVGPVWTTVSAGRGGTLPVGSQVVLADLSQPLPASSATTVRIGVGGGAGRFGAGAGAGFARPTTGSR